MRKLVVGLLAFVLLSCSTYREHLNRGQRLYDENEFERALAIWRSLELDMDSLSLNDQARYSYLRGMTGYRLGFRPDARHWLAVSKAIEQEHPGGLTPEWKSRLDEALADLNRDVYGGAEGGISSESTAVEHTGAVDESGAGAPPPGTPPMDEAPPGSAPPAPAGG